MNFYYYAPRDFPGGPVVKTLPSKARGVDLIPTGGAKILQALQPDNQNIKKKKKVKNLLKTSKELHVK